MLNISWFDSLKQTITSLKKNNRVARIAIVGIGHELRGDDAAGVLVARKLNQRTAHQKYILVIEGGSAPENVTGSLRRFAPDLVLFVDAAQMNEPSGSVHWLSWETTTGLSASTHTMPLYVLARYLIAELGCEVALIGIQPEQMNIGATLSPAVKRSVDEIVQSFLLICGGEHVPISDSVVW